MNALVFISGNKLSGPSGYNYMLSSSGSDTFIINYDSSGNSIWATRISNSSSGSGIYTDSLGNIYTIFRVNDINKEPIIYNSDNTVTISSFIAFSSNLRNANLVKYNSSGIAQWARGMSDVTGSGIIACSIDSSNNVCIIISSASSGTRLYNEDGTYVSVSGLTTYAAILGRYTSDGVPSIQAYMKATNWLSSSIGARGLIIDSSGNIIIVINFYGSSPITVVDISGTSTAVSVSGTPCNVIIKFNSSGKYIWSFINTNQAAIADGTVPTYVSTDVSNNIYIVGTIGSLTVTFYDTTGSSLALVASYSYVVKYNASGVITWAKKYQLGTVANIRSYGSVQDSSGNIYISCCGGNSTFLFIIKINKDGGVVWSFGDALTTTLRSYDMYIDASNNICICGIYKYATTSPFPRVLDISNNSIILSTINTSGSSYNEAYVVKYTPAGFRVFTNHSGSVSANVSLYLSITTNRSSNTTAITGTYTSIYYIF